jgi:predicted Zn finger-like uncharacterized protein
VTIEVQCTSCHTRYRIDDKVLPAGPPTFKCSRCGHVFTFDPRGSGSAGDNTETPTPAPRAPRVRRELRQPVPEPAIDEEASAKSRAEWGAANSPSAPLNDDTARKQTESPPESVSAPASSSGEKKSATEELSSRPFRDQFSSQSPDEETSAGENLKFDFSDEHPEPETVPPPAHNIRTTIDIDAAQDLLVDRHDGDWQVGEADFEAPPRTIPVAAPVGVATSPPPAQAAPSPAVQQSAPEPPRGPQARADQSPQFIQTTPASWAPKAPSAPKPSNQELDPNEFLDEDAAPIYNRSVVTHSSRFFIALFILIALGYGALTVLIRSAPATAAEVLSHLPKIGDRFVPPLTAARLVAMRDVHSDYLQTKGGHTALVVTGIAENVGGASLHAVQIAARISDIAEHTLASRAAYCGNNLSASMVAQMTPHEIEFYQKLDPPKTFALEPATTSPFVIVFVDPPATVSRFDVSVASAVASAAAPVPTSG